MNPHTSLALLDDDERDLHTVEGESGHREMVIVSEAEAYKGRPEDAKRNAGIATMFKAGSSWTAVQQAFGCSRATVAEIAKRAATTP